MPIKIYHNPRCSKSRQTLALLTDRGIEPEVIEYLKTPPSASELTAVVKALGVEPRAVMRSGEDEFKSARDEIDAMNNKQQLNWLAQNPRVLQRPIVVSDKGARIGRPPEDVLEIL